MDGNPRCIHTVLDGDIHEMKFTEVSRRAVDALIDELEALVRGAAPEATLRVIIDNQRQKPQPVAYGLARIREKVVALPDRPPLRAVILEDGFFASILDGVFRAALGRRDRMRVFGYDERDKMLEWLLRDD